MYRTAVEIAALEAEARETMDACDDDDYAEIDLALRRYLQPSAPDHAEGELRAAMRASQ